MHPPASSKRRSAVCGKVLQPSVCTGFRKCWSLQREVWARSWLLPVLGPLWYYCTPRICHRSLSISIPCKFWHFNSADFLLHKNLPFWYAVLKGRPWFVGFWFFFHLFQQPDGQWKTCGRTEMKYQYLSSTLVSWGTDHVSHFPNTAPSIPDLHVSVNGKNK